MAKKENFKILIYLVFAGIISVGLSISIQSILAAWTAPTAVPPGNNISEPVNRGDQHQDKTGTFNFTNTMGATRDFFVGSLASPTFYADGINKRVGIGSATAVNSTLYVKQTGNPTYMMQFHANNDNPWLAGFYNDTYSLTTPSFEYFAWNDGKFAMGTHDNKDFSLYTNGYSNSRLTITGAGNVGIGETAPSARLSIRGNANDNVLYIASSTDNKQLLSMDSVGRLRIGQYSSAWASNPAIFDTGSGPNNLIISGQNRDLALVSVGPADGGKADIDYFRAVGDSIDAPGPVDSTTVLGQINWRGYMVGASTGDNAPFSDRIATIMAQMDGSPSATSLPTKLAFYTTGKNETFTEGIPDMVIKSGTVAGVTGNVGIGTANPSHPLTVKGTAVMGENNTITGLNSFAFGYWNTISARYSTAIGESNTISGEGYNFAAGSGNNINGGASGRGIAMGYNNTAADLSVAMGYFNNATTEAVAIGRGTTASNNGAVALGFATTASGVSSFAVGDSTKARGSYSTAIGRGIEVTGAYSMGIALNNQTGTNVTANNTLAIMGGNVGIGTASPQSALHIPDGKYVQFEDNNAGAPLAADCDSNLERGRMSIDTTNNLLYICNGATRGWDYIALTN